MARPTLSTVFTAHDMMSPQIKKMQDSVSRMSEKIQQVNGQASGSFLNLRNAAIVTLGSLAIRKVNEFEKEFASLGDEIAKTSARLGLSSEELQKLRYAMGQQGVSSETLTQSFEVLNKNLGLLQNNQGLLYSKLRKSNPEMLKQLRNTKSNYEAFTLLMDAINNQTDATEKAALSTIAFAGAGQMMILAAAGGSEKIQKLSKDAERFGVISNEDAAKAESLTDSMDNLSKASQGLRNVGYAPLLELLIPLNNKMANYIASNKEFIALGMQKVLELLFKAFDILKIGMDTGLIPVIIAMKLAFEAAKLAIVAQTAVTTAYTVIQSILDVGLIATTKLIIAQNAAWLASPLGIVIVLIAAVSSGIYLLYKNMELIDGILQSLWNWFKELNIVLKILVGYLALTAVAMAISFAPVLAPILAITIALYALVKAYKWVKSQLSGEPLIEDSNTPELPGMSPIERNQVQSANSGMLSQTINRNNNSNVVVDFKNLPQFANVTQKGSAPNVTLGTGKGIDPFVLYGMSGISGK
jgi:hypothetical protein